VLGWAAEAGGYEEGADLVAVQAGGVGLVVEAGAANVDSWGAVQDAVLFGVAVEPGDRGQPSGDGGPGPAQLLEVAGEALDVGTADIEQAQVAALAPGDELAQVEGVGVTGQSSVAAKKPVRANRSASLNRLSATTTVVDGTVVATVAPPGQA